MSASENTGGKRKVEASVPARITPEGDGFEVRRALPTPGLDRLGPFILLDHMGPFPVKAGARAGFPEHPHAGIETLTYLLEGGMSHRDSLGNASVMGPGEAQWMRAGRGILHEENPSADLRRDGGTLTGIQFWLDLPPEHKREAPAYRQIGRDEIAEAAIDGGQVRVITGELAGLTGPLRTFGDPLLAHVRLEPGRTVTLAAGAEQLGIYVFNGSVTVAGRAVDEGNLVLLGRGDQVEIGNDGGKPADAMLVGGPAMHAPLVRYGPFVTNTPEAMRETITAFQRGEFGQLPVI